MYIPSLCVLLYEHGSRRRRPMRLPSNTSRDLIFSILFIRSVLLLFFFCILSVGRLVEHNSPSVNILKRNNTGARRRERSTLRWKLITRAYTMITSQSYKSLIVKLCKNTPIRVFQTNLRTSMLRLKFVLKYKENAN